MSWTSSPSLRSFKTDDVFSGPTLEEIARIFDGHDAQVADIDIVGEKGMSIRNNSNADQHEGYVHHEKA